MCQLFKKYPGFNMIEIIAELEAPATKQRFLKVIKENHAKQSDAGRTDVTVPHAVYSLKKPGWVLIKKMSDCLMAISFYNWQWQIDGLKCFRKIDELQSAIYRLGGQVTILTPNQTVSAEIEDYQLNLHFYFNPADIVAASPITPEMHIVFSENQSQSHNSIKTLAADLVEDFYKTLFTHFASVAISDTNAPELKYA